MELLVWIHVISAIVGIGPTFVFGFFLNKNQTVSQLSHSLNLLNRMLLFNKIGGPVAVLSGIALIVIGNYEWLQLWIIGALVIYILITAIAIPLGNKMNALQKWAENRHLTGEASLPSEQKKTVKQLHNTINVIHVLSILLFTLMILKPVIF